MFRYAIMLLFAFLASSTAQAQIQQIRMAVGALPSTPVGRGAEFYRDNVNRELEGNARIELTPHTSRSAITAVHGGAADLAVVDSSLLAHQYPLLTLFDLPFFFQNLTELAAMQRSIIGEATLNAINADQLVGLAYWNSGMSHLFGSKPISRVDDLRGLKLRTTVSPPAQVAAQELGAVTLAIPFADTVAALNEGQIDLVEMPPAFVTQRAPALRFRNYSKVNYRPAVSVVVASERFWKATSFRVQSVLVERAWEVAFLVNADAENSERQASQTLEKEVITVTATPSQFRAFGEAALSSWRKVEPLQRHGFLDAALSTREELRRSGFRGESILAAIAAAPSELRKVTIFFATDRLDEKDPNHIYRFGSKRGALTWGDAEVAIDPDRPLGSGGSGTVWLAKIIPHPTEAAFIAGVKSQLDRSRRKAVLVYIHGYKTSFKKAVESAGQIAADIKFDGATLVFSWPSDGVTLKYPSDEEEVLASKGNFIATLKTLAGIQSLQKIHVIAHSMGGRLAATSLEWLNTQPAKGRPHLYHLILAAPDIFVTLFKQAIPGMHGLSKRVTVYGSKWDQALWCSFYYHDAPRAGLGGDNVVVSRHIDTVDISPVETPSTSLLPWGLIRKIPCTPVGHSYVSRNPAVLTDIYELLTYDTAPRSRQRLHEQQKDGLSYWMLR